MANKKESNGTDIPADESGCMVGFNGLILRPVSASESGEGLPYAPVNWPNPGDNWRWKVGKRKNVSGFWFDRYLYPPDHLPNISENTRILKSRLSVEQYIWKHFPDADINAFFASFSWKIPAEVGPSTKGYVRRKFSSDTLSKVEPAEHSSTESESETIVCKAGNMMCSRRLEARTNSPVPLECDICCSERGFCRDCCCILCCKTIDWANGGFSFIRCEANVSESYICGHVAHIDCALHCKMGGTIGGSIGLDVEYYCRRCDKRTDLISYVTGLLQTTGSIDSRDDVEKILDLGLCILRGSHRPIAKRLRNDIELAITKLKSGTSAEDIWKMEGSILASSTGDIFHLENNSAMIRTAEVVNDRDHLNIRSGVIERRSQEPVYISSDHGTASIELEKEINQVLQKLKTSQENEYRIAGERLYAQKDFLVSLYQKLEMERSELGKRTSNTGGDFDASFNVVFNKVNQIEQEIINLKNMEEIGHGFGRVSKSLLKGRFGLEI